MNKPKLETVLKVANPILSLVTMMVGAYLSDCKTKTTISKEVAEQLAAKKG